MTSKKMKEHLGEEVKPNKNQFVKTLQKEECGAPLFEPIFEDSNHSTNLDEKKEKRAVDEYIPDSIDDILDMFGNSVRRSAIPSVVDNIRDEQEDDVLEEFIETESDYDSFSAPELLDEVKPDEETTVGIIDNMKGNKKIRSKVDVGVVSPFIKWVEKYLDSIYKAFYLSEGKVIIKLGHEGGFVNLNSMEIVLYDKIINDLWESGIPPLLIFYHEIGHVLYTIKELVDYGTSLEKQSFTLLNWLEDFYVEERLMKELYFIKPYINMLHEVVPDFIDDWEKPVFALHYYYCYEGLTPRWMDKAGIATEFKRYIEQLKHLRISFGSRFGREKFIRMFEEFYMFCVKHGILTKKTPPPPLEPRPKGAGEGSKSREPGSGKGGSYTGDEEGSGGSYGEEGEGEGEGEGEKAGEGTYADDDGEDVPESKIIRPPFKPLDPAKGFDDTFKELMALLEKEYSKSLFDSFKLAKKGKPELVPITRATSSPRSMIDPVAIETMREDIYLEYTTEEFSYTAYNLFIDVSGSVGYNPTFNTLGRDIINIIKHYPYAVYGYGDDVTKWDQKRIDDILKLRCRDGTESPIIGDIILEKKELGNLNIILSDGDLGNLCRRKDIKDITKQYLFVFVVSSSGGWGGYAEKYFDPNQYYVLNKVEDLPKGIAHLQKYIKNKGL